MENPVGFNFWLFTAVFSCFHVYSKCAQKLDVRLLCCGFLALCVPHVWIISQVFPLIWIQNGFYYALPVQRHFPSAITCTAVQTTKPSGMYNKYKKQKANGALRNWQWFSWSMSIEWWKTQQIFLSPSYQRTIKFHQPQHSSVTRLLLTKWTSSLPFM